MKKFLAFILVALTLAGCNSVDNKVVPSYVVHLDLSTYALWNVYGVNGVGDYRIFDRTKGTPKNFAYNANTYTGFGGVLLMMGLNIETGAYSPIAYDAACPVCLSHDIIVSINSEYEAVCPTCSSHYNVLTGSGGPTSGKALTNKVGMRMYKCRASSNGGYVISSN